MIPEMAFASGKFNPKKYEESEYGKSAIDMEAFGKRYKNDRMNQKYLRHWENLGVKKDLYCTGANEGEACYSVFYPENMSGEKKYPMLYVSHGGGDDNTEAENYGFGELVKKEQVICVFAQNGGRGNRKIEEEFPRIYKEVIEKYPIDTGRVYAVGFSAGSGASIKIGLMFPELIAGVGAIPGPNSFRAGFLQALLETYGEKNALHIPLICAGGNCDGGDAWPLDREEDLENFQNWMTRVSGKENYKKLSVSEVKKLYGQSEDTVESSFGLRFDKTWIDMREGTYYYCGEYRNEKNVSVARFILVEGMPHRPSKGMCKEIWEYLRDYSRACDTGKSVYTPSFFNPNRKK